jgi:GNAT superfamily N-acetyltransferase
MQFATVGDWIESILVQVIEGASDAPASQVSREASDSIRVVTYEPGLYAKVMEFIARGWPARNKLLQPKRWDWMYVESAKRLQTHPQVWLAEYRGEIVGHMGAQFTKVHTKDGELVTGWFVETMVLESYRKAGIGAQITLQAEEDMPMALSLGQTAEIRGILNSLGWKQICPLHIHIFMNNPRRVVRGKLPLGLDRLYAMYVEWNAARKRALQASRSQEIRIHRIERFGSSHDELWGRMKRNVGCLAVRDSSFLNWKYIEQPGQAYDCWEVMIDDALVGIFVTKIESECPAYPYRRLVWVDLVCDLTPASLDTVIQACVKKSEELGVDAISVHLTNGRIEERLAQQGFVRRPETRYLYASRGLIASHSSLLSEDWLVTLGDSDIDRPQ